jgi:16S rRNA (cytosine1402-N4)-methyltransferase
LGDGGHTEEALKLGCQVVSFDIDPESIARSTKFLSGEFSPLIINDYETYTKKISADTKWIIVKTNFVNVSEALRKLEIANFDGIMVDLGPSQYQILSYDRGFSFDSDSDLDMRLDKNLGVTAKDLLNALNEGELRMLLEMGDETFARIIARVIVSQRQKSPITTGKQLAELVNRVKRVKGKTNAATQTFMALRMAVNLERENISVLIPQLSELLNPNGIIGIISFHSGEDKIVKNLFQELEIQKKISVITPKPLLPSSQELQISNRTRSAKLRLAQKNY